MKKESIVVINGHMEFIVPDSKMELVRALLFEVCEGASGVGLTPGVFIPPDKGASSNGR